MRNVTLGQVLLLCTATSFAIGDVSAVDEKTQGSPPYAGPIIDVHLHAFPVTVPEYERRLESGSKWPGWVEKISQYSNHKKLGVMPASIHLLDDRVLPSLVESAGLIVERKWLYQRADLPKELRLDGRESLGLVAVKPRY